MLLLVTAGLTFAATYFWLQAREHLADETGAAGCGHDSGGCTSTAERSDPTRKDEALRLRAEVDQELKDRRAEVTRLERRLQQKEETADKKADILERREKSLQGQERELETLRIELDGARERQRQELERVARLSTDEAKKLLLDEIEEEVREIAGRKIRQIEQETKEEANRRAMQILATAVQRCAPEYVAESTVSGRSPAER